MRRLEESLDIISDTAAWRFAAMNPDKLFDYLGVEKSRGHLAYTRRPARLGLSQQSGDPKIAVMS